MYARFNTELSKAYPFVNKIFDNFLKYGWGVLDEMIVFFFKT